MIKAFENDFADFINLLNKHNVNYMVIGGYAVQLHGEPRFTFDLDIWIKPELINAENMVKVVEEFGFGFLGFTIDDYLKENIVTQIGNPPLRIDICQALKV